MSSFEDLLEEYEAANRAFKKMREKDLQTSTNACIQSAENEYEEKRDEVQRDFLTGNIDSSGYVSKLNELKKSRKSRLEHIEYHNNYVHDNLLNC